MPSIDIKNSFWPPSGGAKNEIYKLFIGNQFLKEFDGIVNNQEGCDSSRLLAMLAATSVIDSTILWSNAKQSGELFIKHVALLVSLLLEQLFAMGDFYFIVGEAAQSSL